MQPVKILTQCRHYDIDKHVLPRGIVFFYQALLYAIGHYKALLTNGKAEKSHMIQLLFIRHKYTMLWVGSNKTANVLRIQAIYKPEIVFGDSSQNGFFSMKFLFKLQ